MKTTSKLVALIVIPLFLLTIGASAKIEQQYAPVNGIAIYSQNELFGYLKTDGSLLTEAVYDYVAPFQYGYAVVGQSNLLGCIDMQGKEIIPCIYDAIYYATDDPANMRLLVDKEGVWGVLDGNGNVICDVVYDMVNGVFNENIVVEKDGLMGLFDSNGNVVVPVEWEWIFYMSDGWALVYISDENEGKYSFVNINNKTMQTYYTYAAPFNEGCAFVMEGNDSFYINTDGKRISLNHWDSMHDICSQSLIGVLKDGKWGYISQEGNILISPFWDEAYPFSQDGLALVCQDNLYGYIDKTGTLITEVTWPVAYDFVDGYAIVATENGYGMIDTTGEYVVSPCWTDIQYPAEGMIAVYDSNYLWGFIDMNGQIIIECKYPFADYFCDDCVCVWDTDDNALWLDKFGAIVCPPIPVHY